MRKYLHRSIAPISHDQNLAEVSPEQLALDTPLGMSASPGAAIDDDTIPNNTSTTAVVFVGSNTASAIDYELDDDWFRVTLTAGQSYTFTVSASTGDDVEDSVLILYDQAGTQILAGNDDILPLSNLYSRVTYTARTSGDHFLSVTGYDEDYTGSYILSAQRNDGLDLDFSGDARSDILWRSNTGALATWENINGTGHTGQNFNVATAWKISARADINNDGRSDIVWRGANGDVVAWTNVGGNSYTGVNLGSAGNNWTLKGAGDTDGDGYDDLLFRSSTGEVVVWRSVQFYGSNDAVSYGNVANSWKLVGTGDFDGDGKSDLLFRGSSGQVVIWANLKSDGTKTPINLGTVGLNWHIEGTGDFGADGKSDILFRSNSGDTVIWNNIQSTGAHGSSSLGNVAGGWSVAGVGDYDGDGQADILWRNVNTNQVVTWDDINGTTKDVTVIGSVGNTWTAVKDNFDFV